MGSATSLRLPHVVCHKSKTVYNSTQPQMLSQVISSPDSNSTQPQMLSQVISRADSNVHHRQGSKRSRSQTCGRHNEVADPIRMENPTLHDPHTRSLRQDYICGYCDRGKTSMVRCVQGRVRLRCKCGGQQNDGKLRLHSNWSIAGSRKNFFVIIC